MRTKKQIRQMEQTKIVMAYVAMVSGILFLIGSYIATIVWQDGIDAWRYSMLGGWSFYFIFFVIWATGIVVFFTGLFLRIYYQTQKPTFLHK